ncbi:MOXD1 homolog 1-like [Haliotis asinina]|uniref:MOXD1 homolog 1-like n=1 Tax=Haliotis asinina TaxID=109174 RepID=UPI0035322475
MLDALLLSSRWTLFLVTLLHTASGYFDYQAKIPNGNNVPSPCKAGETWPGVGHKLMSGGGARNAFGQDFADSGREWTRALCEKDSDGDGWTNGQELGDPNCTWSQGTTNSTSSPLSHPGVCDPWTDPKCLARDESWVLPACQNLEFTCNGINDVSTKKMDLKLPRTVVPAAETTYMCQIFSIPNDTDYHIIATQPLIDNVNIMHHAVVFGCTKDEAATPNPYPCGMLPGLSCNAIVSLWSLGNNGDCKHENVGIRFGMNGFKKLALQVHWNNPKKRSDYFDQSGMRIYYTPNLRTYDAGILTTGQDALLIPPGETSVKVHSTVPSACTSRFFTGTIYVTAALNHMHYLGVSQTLELYRNGVKIRDLSADPKYNYDNPIIHRFKDPIEIQPGDELRTRCEFESSKKSTTTIYGDATSNEMCYSFITYYPRQNAKRLFFNSFLSIHYCMLDMLDTYEGCPWRAALSLTDPKLLSLYFLIDQNCNLFEKCSPSCYNAIQTAKQHKCLQGDMWRFLMRSPPMDKRTVTFLMKWRSCQCEDAEPPSAPPTAPDTVAKPNNSTCDWAGLDPLDPVSVDNPLGALISNITSNCITIGICLKECVQPDMAARKHKCFQGTEWEYGRRYLYERSNFNNFAKFLLGFESCNCEISATPTTTPATTPDTTTTTIAATPPTTGAYSFQCSHRHLVLITFMFVFSTSCLAS